MFLNRAEEENERERK